jgi:hypothetical protein
MFEKMFETNKGEVMLFIVLLTIGSTITIAFEVWHLFVPLIWKWYSYFPKDAKELIVAVRAINLFFSISLIMFGLIMMVFINRKPIGIFYVKCIGIALSIIWGTRIISQLIWPQGSISPILQYGMLGTFILTFIILAFATVMLKK